jgi:hypothetical protein
MIYFGQEVGRLVMKMEVSERIPELQFFDYVGAKSSTG